MKRIAIVAILCVLCSATAFCDVEPCQVCHESGELMAGKKVRATEFHANAKTGKEKTSTSGKKLTDDQIRTVIKYIHLLK